MRMEHETVEFGCSVKVGGIISDGFYIRLTLNLKTAEFMTMEVEIIN